MTWKDQLRSDSLQWLLEFENPGMRYLALRDLLELPAEDRELKSARKSAHKEGPIAAVLSKMEKEGYWVKPGPGYTQKYRSTVWSIILLAQLGASTHEDKRIALACKYLLDHMCEGGQFTSSTSGVPSGTIDCLQGNLCWSLMQIGYDDPRLEKAYEWMARTVTGDGIAPAEDKDAAVRYYYFKSGPTFACGINNKLSCAWGGVKVMLALGKIPVKGRTPLIKKAIRQGADFFLEHRSGNGRISDAQRRCAQPQLVEVRLPGVLHHRFASACRSDGQFGLWQGQTLNEHARYHPRKTK